MMAEYRMNRWIIAGLMVFFIFLAGGVAMYAGNLREELNKCKQQNQAALVQNVQLTKDVRQAKADGFKAGLITCSNEDVEWLNELGSEYSGTKLGDIFTSMAQGWAYDDDTMSEMVSTYMTGVTN
jgi:hypothetical protein